MDSSQDSTIPQRTTNTNIVQIVLESRKSKEYVHSHFIKLVLLKPIAHKGQRKELHSNPVVLTLSNTVTL